MSMSHKLLTYTSLQALPIQLYLLWSFNWKLREETYISPFNHIYLPLLNPVYHPHRS